MSVSLIVGLGNPGREYEDTRHNAGAWFVETLARKAGVLLSEERKFHGLTARINFHGHDIRLLVPTTFMNRSGEAVLAMSQFYKLAPANLLVAHDELDLEPGHARFKQGGSGGGNGIKDICQRLGSKDFHRLRIGIGHPGHSSQVVSHVLNKPTSNERISIDKTIDAAITVLPLALDNQWAKAMQALHSFSAI